MPDSLTPLLGLTKPQVGASRDTWGAKLNADLDIIDEIVGTSMPIGATLDFAGPTAPSGFLICDGRLVSRTTYSALFAVIATYWGAGDGSTTFALPPTPGRASVGPGTVTDIQGVKQAFLFAKSSGALGNVITQANLPNISIGYAGAHSHGGVTTTVGDHMHDGYTTSVGNHFHVVPDSTKPGAGGVAPGVLGIGGASQTDVTGAHVHDVKTYGGGSHSHLITAEGSHTHSLGGSGTTISVVQPVIVMTKIIYAGSQASLAVLGAASPAMRRRLSAPLRGSH